jgi:hypothetical protein
MADTQISGLMDSVNTGLLASTAPSQSLASGEQHLIVPETAISHLQNEVVRLSEERDSLAASITSLDQARRRQLADFQSSYSWRWTKPLRWAAARLLGRPNPDS